MDTVALPQIMNSGLQIYGYGLTTGLLFTTAIYMTLLAFFYLNSNHLQACKLFIYNALCNFLFIFFDIFSISIHSPELSKFFPVWILKVGEFIMPLALLISFTMFVKVIPIKTTDAFFFWDRSKRFYPLANAVLIGCFFLIIVVNNSKLSFVVSLILIILMCVVEYLIAHKTLQLNRYGKLQKLVILSLIGCFGTTIAVFLSGGFDLKSFNIDLNPLWFGIRLAIGTLVIIFSFIVSRFIMQEMVYTTKNSKINGEDFFKEIYNATKHHHFFIEYQPKINLKDHKISGTEALIRWEHPKHGLIPPNDFIPLAERTDLINEICKWVIVRVIKDIKDMEYIDINVPISINFSVNNLHKDMVDFLIDTLEKYDVSSSMIVVEITETMFLDMNEEHNIALQMLRDANIMLSMDDFGAGHSSFAYFDEIGLNELKLDRKIVCNILTADKEKVVATIINLCHSLDIKVVAEGIEDNEIQAKLLDLGCDHAQGYGICRPKRLADFIDWVRFEHRTTNNTRESIVD